MKKGFTLVELLAVLFIIGLISVLAIATITKHANELKKISNSEIEELIKSSAKSYIYDNENIKKNVKAGKKVSIEYQLLKQEGYISNDIVDIKSYKKIDINKYCVCVTYENYDYIYNIMLKEECVE